MRACDHRWRLWPVYHWMSTTTTTTTTRECQLNDTGSLNNLWYTNHLTYTVVNMWKKVSWGSNITLYVHLFLLFFLYSIRGPQYFHIFFFISVTTEYRVREDGCHADRLQNEECNYSYTICSVNFIPYKIAVAHIYFHTLYTPTTHPHLWNTTISK